MERCTSNPWIAWPDKATYEATATKMETDERWKARFLTDFRAPSLSGAGGTPSTAGASDVIVRTADHGLARKQSVSAPLYRCYDPFLITHRRRQAGRMNQCQYPHCFAVDLIHQAIAFVRDQLAGAGNPPRLATMGMLSQQGGCVAEQFIHSRGRTWVVGSDVVPYVGAVLLRF